MKTWAIGEVAAKAGVATSAIRYYEQIELLPPPQRINGRRRYDDAILQKLNIIRLAKQIGFTIAEVQVLVNDFPAVTPPSARWQVLAQQKLAELDERLQTIQAMKTILEQTLNCQCKSLEECSSGVEQMLVSLGVGEDASCLEAD